MADAGVRCHGVRPQATRFAIGRAGSSQAGILSKAPDPLHGAVAGRGPAPGARQGNAWGIGPTGRSQATGRGGDGRIHGPGFWIRPPLPCGVGLAHRCTRSIQGSKPASRARRAKRSA